MLMMSVTSSPNQQDSTVGQFTFTIHDPGNGDLGPFDITKSVPACKSTFILLFLQSSSTSMPIPKLKGERNN
jgi:hypothetical protein